MDKSADDAFTIHNTQFIAVSFPGFLRVEMLYWIVGGCLALVGVFTASFSGLTKKSEKTGEAHSLEQTGAV